ncbi:MAG: response regulator receiver protein [Bryobacterales bacterium]|jgi:HD-like signal output (HDOD) protein|nr:response regulator receiver protein [Bryobacterales bacterium]
MALVRSDQRSRTRKQAVLSLERVPALSPTATQLLGRLARRNCDVHELAVLIERDPLLSAQILGIANSAAFGRAHPISSIQHAIAMIGIGTVRKFALARSISNLFGRRKIAPSFSITRFNLHSVATGMFLELLAEHVPLEDPEDAFLAGLFHDVGKLVIAVALPEQYEAILAAAAVTREPVLKSERLLLQTDHAELSAMAVDYWGLGESIRAAAAYHHEPDKSPAVSGKISLALAVSKVDAVVNAGGMSLLAAPLIAPEIPPLIFDGFSVDQESLIKRFAIEWTAAGVMFR